jgi:hypothetical protein
MGYIMLLKWSTHMLDDILSSLTELDRAILVFHLNWTNTGQPSDVTVRRHLGLSTSGEYQHAIRRILGTLREQLGSMGIGSSFDLDFDCSITSKFLEDVQLSKFKSKSVPPENGFLENGRNRLYRVTLPDGSHVIVKNLRQFAAEHNQPIANLYPGGKTSKVTRTGYKIEKLPTEQEAVVN